MRTGEVFALTWDDIDLDNRIIKISKTVYAKDKEEKGRWYLGTTKTIWSQRNVYICDTLYNILLDYKNTQDNYKKQYGKLVEYRIVESNSIHNKVDMVFTRRDGTYSGTDIVKYPFKVIHHELGIKCRFYDLRGSFATISLRNSCEIKDIAEVLGHRRIETTEKYYITSTEVDKNEVIKLFENSIRSNVN
mgnify:CR=1 FL=1